LLRPDEGTIRLLGIDITQMREKDLLELRRRVGIVFQESALFDSLNVEDNVGYRLFEEKMPEAEVREKVSTALRFVELEHAIDKMPAELSGGMRRRVAIARAMITQPDVLLYDSPTGGLDPITSTTIIELIVKQRDVFHTTSLLVTHRLQDAFLLATRAFNQKTNQLEEMPKNEMDQKTSFLMLNEGKIVFNGTTHDLVTSEDSFIQTYLG
jgi:phospholipid/cholesterol/gamma-HCH transport system ATP-binding protein